MLIEKKRVQENNFYLKGVQDKSRISNQIIGLLLFSFEFRNCER